MNEHHDKSAWKAIIQHIYLYTQNPGWPKDCDLLEYVRNQIIKEDEEVL